jgi:hypothetical protein
MELMDNLSINNLIYNLGLGSPRQITPFKVGGQGCGQGLGGRSGMTLMQSVAHLSIKTKNCSSNFH